ncbi:hypothetical protein ATY30_28360 [Sinorhizobium americanum]|nr:hypothetical protein CO664_24055 [Sinorhizobium sp. NG07B]POH24963.1 hypothetical protein ATY30_28360 [Sinorhizobium americanum]
MMRVASRSLHRFLDDMRLAWLPLIGSVVFLGCLVHPSIITDQLDEFLVDYGHRASENELS